MSYGNLSWKDVENIAKTKKSVLVPIGSIEQHGMHLPLFTDSIIADEIAKKAGEILGMPVLPVIPAGFSREHVEFPGTISVSESRLKGYVEDVCKSLKKNGFSSIIIVNGHGGNCNILEKLCKELSGKLKINVSTVENFQLINNENCQVHADEMETSLMLYLYPHLVNKDKIIDEFPERFKRNFGGLFHWRKYTKSGVIGYPSRGLSKNGEVYFNKMVGRLVKFIKTTTRD